MIKNAQIDALCRIRNYKLILIRENTCTFDQDSK